MGTCTQRPPSSSALHTGGQLSPRAGVLGNQANAGGGVEPGQALRVTVVDHVREFERQRQRALPAHGCNRRPEPPGRRVNASTARVTSAGNNSSRSAIDRLISSSIFPHLTQSRQWARPGNVHPYAAPVSTRPATGADGLRPAQGPRSAPHRAQDRTRRQ